MADNNGGWEDPKVKLQNQKILKQCLGESLGDSKSNKLKSKDNFYIDGSVVICNPQRFISEYALDNKARGLPPLTNEHLGLGTIEKLVTNMCIKQGKTGIQRIDYLSLDHLNEAFIKFRCGLTNKELEIKKKKEEQQSRLKKQKNIKAKIQPFEKQCTELGFKKGTKNFKDCVVELM